MTEKFELSRRKALLGLTTIGAAGAAAGYGTSALFSDDETFESNTIQAGTTNLIVTAEIVENNIGGAGTITLGGEESTSATADGDAAVGINVNDIKPGDSFVVCLDVAVKNNPMYVGVEATNPTDDEGQDPEPEPQPGPDDNDDPIPGGGDLDNMMDVTFGYDANANDNSWDGSITGTEFTGTLTDFMQLSQLYRGRGGEEAPRPAGHGGAEARATRIGEDGSLADVDNVTHYARFELPASVGNEVQGDTASWDLVWHAEQVRNNAEPSTVSELDGSPN